MTVFVCRITREQDALERILRNETTTGKAMESGMQRLMQLVNEKNSLVRRQMQLNIAEQVKRIVTKTTILKLKSLNDHFQNTSILCTY